MDQVGRRIMCECVNGGNEHFYTRRRDYRASTCRDTVHKEQMSERRRRGDELQMAGLARSIRYGIANCNKHDTMFTCLMKWTARRRQRRLRNVSQITMQGEGKPIACLHIIGDTYYGGISHLQFVVLKRRLAEYHLCRYRQSMLPYLSMQGERGSEVLNNQSSDESYLILLPHLRPCYPSYLSYPFVLDGFFSPSFRLPLPLPCFQRPSNPVRPSVGVRWLFFVSSSKLLPIDQTDTSLQHEWTRMNQAIIII